MVTGVSLVNFNEAMRSFLRQMSAFRWVSDCLGALRQFGDFPFLPLNLVHASGITLGVKPQASCYADSTIISVPLL